MIAAKAASDPSNPLTAAEPAEDYISAQIAAKMSGERVEALSERTETEQTFLNPDGTSTVEMTAVPVRVQDDKADDGWRDISLDLVVREDGTISPESAFVDVTLSGKRTDQSSGIPIAELSTQSEKTLSVDWAGELPTPKISGDTATYEDVAPDTDLVVTATRFGFEQFFVIKSEPANPEQIEFPLDIDSAGLTIVDKKQSPLSGMNIESDSGKVVGEVSPATTWDASTNKIGNPDNIVTSEMTIAKEGGSETLVLSPDPDFLSDPTTEYPVTIDPSFTVSGSANTSDTYVKSNSPDNTYVNDNQLLIGRYSSTEVYRSFLTFNVAGSPGEVFPGSYVTNATLSLWNFHSATCSPEVVAVGYSNKKDLRNTSWNNQPAVDSSTQTLVSASRANWCGNADFLNFNVTGQSQRWAREQEDHFSFGVWANESITSGFKGFDSSEGGHPPKLAITYDSRPLTPVVTWSSAGKVNTTEYVGTPNPTFYARVNDAENQAAKILFEVNDEHDNFVDSCESPIVPSGTQASCTLDTALTDNKKYSVTAQTQSYYNGELSKWSADKAFYTSTKAPSNPSIGCDLGVTPNNMDSEAGQWYQTVNSPNCGVLAPSNVYWGTSDPTELWTSVDGQNAILTTGPFHSSLSTELHPPSTPGVHTLEAVARSVTGNTSATVDSGYGVGQWTAFTSFDGTTSLKTTDNVTLSAQGPAKGTAKTVTAYPKYRLSTTSDPWTAGNAVAATIDGSSTTANYVWSTAGLPQVVANPRIPVSYEVVMCFSYGASGENCSIAITVIHIPHAFGSNFPVEETAGGDVAMWTGELNVVETDASVATPDAELSVTRAHSTFNSLANGSDSDTPADNAFGPGWIASFDTSGGAGYQVTDNTDWDGNFYLTSPDTSLLIFQAPVDSEGAAPAGQYAPVDAETATKQSSLRVVETDPGNSNVLSRRLVLTNNAGTVTTWKPSIADGETVWTVVSVAQPGKQGTVSFQTTGELVTRILAPVPDTGSAPLNCSTLIVGCRALEIKYGEGAAAGPSGPGSTPDQVSSIAYTASNAAGSAMETTVVAKYLYDTSGRLVKVTDPRSGLSTSYTWATVGGHTALASTQDSGLAKVGFSYTASGSQVAGVWRGDATSADGSMAKVSSFVYSIKPASTTGLPALTASDTKKWGQVTAPTYGAAVFGADHPIADDKKAADLSATDWQYAALSYTDSNGYLVNSAGYGPDKWQISYTAYDGKGNIVQQIDSRGITAILDRWSANPGQLFDTNPYATVARYNDVESIGNVTVEAGTYLTDLWGPQAVSVVDGAPTNVRSHTHYTYDQGAPTNGINAATGKRFGLVTKVTVGIASPSTGSSNPSAAIPDDIANVSRVTSGYDPIDGASATGDTSGWILGQVTTETTDMGGSASTPDIVRKTRYNKSGSITEAREPGSSGNDEATKLYVYYSAGANADDSRCADKPQWAGLLCVTKSAAEPTNEDLPDSYVSMYNSSLDLLQEIEKSGSGANSVTRTTANTYLADGRLNTTFTDADGPVTSDQPMKTVIYDSTSGLSLGTRTSNGTTIVGTDQSVLDLWGREVKYTNSLGDVATTSYVAPGNPGAGQILTITDSQGTVTNSYDGTDALGRTERRGFVTSMSVSNVGTYKAAYDDQGAMVLQTAPGNLRSTYEYDTVGRLTGQAYQGTNEANELVDWLRWTRQYDINGRVINEDAPVNGAIASGASPDIHNEYDRAGRLVSTADYTAGAGCVLSAYSYDVRGNRTAKSTKRAAAGAACGTGTEVKSTSSYDLSSRVRTDGYTYDLLGRQTAVPASDLAIPSKGNLALTYFDSDAPRSISQGGSATTVVSQTFSLDPSDRRLTETNRTGTTVTDTGTRHYTESGDNPSWISKVTGSSTVITRYTPSIGGDLGATLEATVVRIDLVSPHGDVVATVVRPITGSATAPTSYSTYDAFGVNTASLPVTGAATYGWLGGKERASLSSGLILMGSRLYNPTTGRFTSMDPVTGGNENAYNYPNDPINEFDISGDCPACAAVLVIGAGAGEVILLVTTILLIGTVVGVAGAAIVNAVSKGNGNSSENKKSAKSQRAAKAEAKKKADEAKKKALGKEHNQSKSKSTKQKHQDGQARKNMVNKDKKRNKPGWNSRNS